ncbi:DUF4124 domain-containing protein [Acinetobacter ursingii]|nr:DUF4124 domain-containing protein [Acinetobacter ursingii]MDA3578733.1 DUF4124 domain-containing protein [Acinetobacter ursingii]MDH0807115.1 DUF4124 domain-containing protein [Acinetobacter ursingii]MDH2074218.1 DUF4124 domain-containing protein [Acinetobacter ursingii]
MNSVIYGRFWAVISLMLLGCTLHTNAQQYYKWVDAHGVTTYSATPPPTQRSNEPQLVSQKNTASDHDKAKPDNFKSNAAIADEYYSPYKQNNKQTVKPVTVEKENAVTVNKA